MSRPVVFRSTMLVLLALTVGPAFAQDVVRPARVTALAVAHDGTDVQLSWDPVTVDAAGNAETVGEYRVYRGDAPDFVPDRASGTNLIGTTPTASYTDLGASLDGADHYYRVTAVDGAGLESDSQDPRITALPVVSGYWTSSTIELDWTDAGPASTVVGYRVYYGPKSRQYEFVHDVGLDTSDSLSGLTPLMNWYATVTAIDPAGNETPFTNEHIDALNGIVRVVAHQGDELCWGAASCTPTDPAKLQRRDGWQLLVPVDFPEGDWKSVNVQFQIESRLCNPPAQGTISKCGPGNPCVDPPCNGGYNPCGDPWDRLAHLFVVLDETCISDGTSCIDNDNLELIRAVTPFGTDAPAPDGTGTIGPALLTMDITPLSPLLTGNRYVGVDIGHFVQKGWWVSVIFNFSENPLITSPEPPADGLQVIGFANAPLPTRQVTIPPTATQVKMRLFTTGHGGGTFCDGGTNDAMPCASGADCPGGGVCNPCDEFCHRTNRILVDGSPLWQVEPWRSDCSPGFPECNSWNACGYPSCTFPRAGWCPGTIACHHDPPCDNDLDFTGTLLPGGTYDIGYDVTPMNGSWPISLVLYWYE